MLEYFYSVSSDNYLLHFVVSLKCGMWVISDFTRYLASTLCDLHYQERLLSTELELLLQSPLFARYVKVFRKFHITGRLAGLILSQIYPIENFRTLVGLKKRLGYGLLRSLVGTQKGRIRLARQRCVGRLFTFGLIMRLLPKSLR